MNEQKFLNCEICGNFIGFINNKGVVPVCCGQKMKELVPNTVDASTEKHMPAVRVEGDKVSVSVGSVYHPMEEAHHIKFIYLETENGGQKKTLAAGSAPSAEFMLVNDKALAVYGYCNLHGLWKTSL